MAAVVNSPHARDIASVIHPYTNLVKHEKTGAADHRGRQGDLRPRSRRQRVHRRPCRSVVHRARLRQRAPHPGGRHADEEAALLPHLLPPLQHARDRARRAPALNRPGADGEGVVRQLRLRGERPHDEVRVVLQQRDGAAGEEKDHRPAQGLPRHRNLLGEPHRSARRAQGIRPPDQERHPHRRPPSLRRCARGRVGRGIRHPARGGARAAHPRRGSRDRRRLHCRARDGRGGARSCRRPPTSRRCRRCAASTTY